MPGSPTNKSSTEGPREQLAIPGKTVFLLLALTAGTVVPSSPTMLSQGGQLILGLSQVLITLALGL